MLDRIRKTELEKIKDQYKKDFFAFQCMKVEEQQGYHCEVMKPLWGDLLISKELIESIVKLYNEVAVKRPKVKIYDIGSGSGLLLVMLYLAGIPYDALVGVELPQEHQWFERKKYWKMTESDSFSVPASGIFLMSFPERGKGVHMKPISTPETLLSKYVWNGGKEVVLIGNENYVWSDPKPSYFSKLSDWSTVEKPMTWYGAGPYAMGMKYSISIRK